MCWLQTAERRTSDFLRLRLSRSEAEQVANLIPAAATREAFDFDANRDAVLKADLARSAFCTSPRTALSTTSVRSFRASCCRWSTVLWQNGFLRLYDVYNLRLNADLVVLSACRIRHWERRSKARG